MKLDLLRIGIILVILAILLCAAGIVIAEHPWDDLDHISNDKISFGGDGSNDPPDWEHPWDDLFLPDIESEHPWQDH